MIGAIIGDIVGSRFEWNNVKTKDFEFFHEDCEFTDDTILTVAVGKAILDSRRSRGGITGCLAAFMDILMIISCQRWMNLRPNIRAGRMRWNPLGGVVPMADERRDWIKSVRSRRSVIWYNMGCKVARCRLWK